MVAFCLLFANENENENDFFRKSLFSDPYIIVIVMQVLAAWL